MHSPGIASLLRAYVSFWTLTLTTKRFPPISVHVHRGSPNHGPGPNPIHEAFPSGPQWHFIQLQSLSIMKKQYIYENFKSPALELLCNSLCGPLTRKFRDPDLHHWLLRYCILRDFVGFSKLRTTVQAVRFFCPTSKRPTNPPRPYAGPRCTASVRRETHQQTSKLSVSMATSVRGWKLWY